MKYFDFYYGDESEQYSFYTVPKMFFDNDKFKDLSPMSKLLYSFLLDRMSLSKKRNWIDDKNRAYIKYSLKAICNDMCVSKNSVIKYMKELQNFGLIRKLSKEGITNKDLPIRRNKKRHKKKAVRVQKRDIAGTSIEDRPEDILTREEFGHWEMDSVIGSRGKSKNTLLTLFERKTRQPIIYKQSDKSSASVVEALDDLEKKLGDKFYLIFKTITVDNGTEFADCEGIERSCIHPGKKRTQVYYCHPYCSSERGSNENGNRMIRRKIPKGTNFDNMSKKEIAQVQKWLENYPRRMFGYKSSKQLYLEEMKLLI